MSIAREKLLMLIGFSTLLVSTGLAGTRFGWGERPGQGSVPLLNQSDETDQRADREVLGDPQYVDGNSIVGSWLVNVVSEEGYRFKSLFTFAVDGTFTGSTQGDVCCGTSITAQHGAWKLGANNRIVMTFVDVVSNTSNGKLLGSQRVRFTIQLANSGWSANWSARDFDPAGRQLGSYNGKATARRISASVQD